ncbi:testis-expressed protein 26-like isoform X1 [Branchiostoma floridae]|uniref:Testis-expressed protein 26-like isoform X1 n=2 Tax=Branchiostoma floridae TaxID=7739 RepID=C3XWH3_BRAFL|nr:testis-expressed protein 26-like isoform X1 [Branchiostoma floridae]|eukprot:XP_002611697.1 hypothetical protein BRAFLDRAFT_117083 [Branchiostoma floridae]
MAATTEILHAWRDLDQPTEWSREGEQLAGQIVLPSFAKNLEKYLQTASSPEDRERCLRLLASLSVQKQPLPHQRVEEQPRRPKSAMPALGREKAPHPAYITTNQREYQYRPGSALDNTRPGTTKHSYITPYQLPEKIGHTTYHDQYYSKGHHKREPIRSGTSSGNRKNNPHPFQSFMVWKFPRHEKPLKEGSQWGTELTDDIMDQVIKDQTKSTYQSDYLGIPQGFQVGNAVDAPLDWKSQVPYSLDSFMRYTYRRPVQEPQLKENTTRYGCNSKKMVPAHGIAPNASQLQNHLKGRTTYQREYNSKNGRVEYRDLNTLDPDCLREMINQTEPGRDKHVLTNILRSVKHHGDHYRELASVSRRTPPTLRSQRPPSTASSRRRTFETPINPKIVSSWVGPV